MAAASHYVFVFMENFQSINYPSQNTLSGQSRHSFLQKEFMQQPIPFNFFLEGTPCLEFSVACPY